MEIVSFNELCRRIGTPDTWSPLEANMKTAKLGMACRRCGEWLTPGERYPVDAQGNVCCAGCGSSDVRALS